MRTIKAYKRSNGEIGIRNTVLILSMIQCANSTTQKIGIATDCPVVTIDTGCGEFKENEERTNLGLIRAGQHPNVFAVLLVSLGCQWTDAGYIGEEIAKSGKKVEHLCIQSEGGCRNTIIKGIEIIEKLKTDASKLQREELPLSKLKLAVYCGGSDWSSSIASNPLVGECVDIFAEQGASYISSPVRGMPGGEQHLVELAETNEIKLKILDICNQYRNDVFNTTGQHISDVNPTPGNKANGITTLREKAISNLELSGTRTKLKGIIEIGDQIPGPGFWIIDNRTGGNDVYATTALAMSGAHICLFTTGQGTPLGTVGMVTLKVCSNPNTIMNLGTEMIDFDGSGIVTEAMTIDLVANDLFDLVIKTANGELSKSEIYCDWSWVTPPNSKI